MIEAQIKNDKVVQLCYDKLASFTDIYANGREINPIPKNVRLTVYCEDLDEEGFVINKTSKEMGLEILIAKKWIIHSELESLAGCSLI